MEQFGFDSNQELAGSFVGQLEEDDFAESWEGGEFLGDDDAFIEYESESENTETINKVIIDGDLREVLSAEEDVEQFRRLQQELTGLGYSVDDSMDYSVLSELKKRVRKSIQDEDSELKRLAEDQLRIARENNEALKQGCATFLSYGTEDTAAENANAVSGEKLLGEELSERVREWVMQAVMVTDDITENELFDSFVSRSGVDSSDIALKDSQLLSYIGTLLPFYQKMKIRTGENFLKQEKSRKRLADSFIEPELENANAILGASKRVFIRQIYDDGDEHYETVCPVCKKRVQLTGPAFRLIAFVSEKGVKKQVYFGHLPCSTEGCDTVFMFSMEEYRSMTTTYFNRCIKSITSFLTTMKRESAGAAVMHTSVPIGAVKDSLENLMIYTGRDEMAVKDEPEKKVAVYVSDEEMRAAAAQFYFKLCGLSGSSARVCCDWTYHDAAVLVTQNLSKDFYVEKNRALFSLIVALKANPFFSQYLSMTGIWTLEVQISFIRQYQSVKSVRALSEGEIRELKDVLVSVGASPPTDTEELICQAKKYLPDLESRLRALKEQRARIFSELKKNEDSLAFTKISKVNACSLSDLQAFIPDDETAEFFNRVAERMIIHSYSSDFCNLWLQSSSIQASMIQKMFDKTSDLSAVERKLRSMCEKGIFSRSALERMQPIYRRDVKVINTIRRLYKSFVDVDYSEFCKAAYSMPTFVEYDSMIKPGIKRMLSKFYQRFTKDAAKTKAQLYLSRDFTIDEIDSCEKCNGVLFERFVLKRLPNESIDEYCERCYEWDGIPSGAEEVYDNFDLISDFMEYGTDVSVCSCVYDAEYESFGKSLFMAALLNDSCTGAGKSLETVLGVTQMQQNIIKTVNPDVLHFADAGMDYRVTHGVYVTSVYVDMDRILEEYNGINVKTDMKCKDLLSVFDVTKKIHDLYDVLEARVDDDGDAVQDTLEAFSELSRYSGQTAEKLLGGVK